MSSSGDRDKIDEIKNRLDIIDVIGQDIDLHHKGGGDYTGSVGRTGGSGESLKVSRSLQAWKDFKNSRGGDVLDWIGFNAGYADPRGADFPEVLIMAADLAGVELAEMTDEERGAAKEKANIHNLFTAAAEKYHKNLTPEHYDYILHQWGITREKVDLLKIGYAKKGRNLKDLETATLKKSGLVYVNGGMTGGEVFQGRIIFPYWKSGKVVYLIGRETEETPDAEREKGMKYKKLLVHKEKHEYVSPSVQNSYFYGEDSLRGSDYCIITEGVADCIAMLQAGFPCISPVTVQFREKDHPKLLSLTKGLKRVYICNDNEANKTGLKGALSTAEALEGAGIEARLIILPKPEDLDKIDIADYMKVHTPDDFNGLIGSSVRLWNYKLDQIALPASLTSLERLRAFTTFISNDIHLMQPAEWQVFVNDEVRKKFRFSKSDIKEVVKEVSASINRGTNQDLDEGPEAGKDGAEENDQLKDFPEWAIDQANDILNNGDPFQFILDTWQKKHIGDTNIGENCLCSVITSCVLNSKRGLHIKPSGESGKGKSDAIECFLELLPEGSYITGSMSAKALFYDKNLTAGTIIYSDDASFTDDVISTIKQSTSKFQNITLHRTVVNGESQVFPIPERITFWFSAVEGMDDEQLANRFLHADVDTSSEQDKRVHQHQKDSEAWYESDTTEPDVLVCRCIFTILFNESYYVKVPFVDAITWNNPENRRNFDKFKDIIRAVTVYNCRKREYFDGFLMATPEDFERALKIYKGTSVNNATNLTDTELKYLRFIVSSPHKTVTLKTLVNHFKVSETAVRKMLNGKKGDGGLLAKVKQLIVIDNSQTIKNETVSSTTREKLYQYTGEFTGLDLYESIACMDYDEVGRVTQQFKATLHENMLRVTKGNLEGNLSRVTLENNSSIHNNNNNNTRVTLKTENEGGEISHSFCMANVNNLDLEKKERNFQVTTFPVKMGYPQEKISQPITETRVTCEGFGGLHRVTLDDKNISGEPETEGYPLNDIENCIKTLSGDRVTPIDSDLTSLLSRALIKFAKDEYNFIVPDIDEFIRMFNKKVPDYQKALGCDAIGYNANKLKRKGWRY